MYTSNLFKLAQEKRNDVDTKPNQHYTTHPPKHAKINNCVASNKPTRYNLLLDMALRNYSTKFDVLRSDLECLTSSYGRCNQTTFQLSHLPSSALECLFQTQQTTCQSRVFCLVQTGCFETLHPHLVSLGITENSTKVYNARLTKSGAIFVALLDGRPVKYYLCEPGPMIELLKFYKEFGHLCDTWHRNGSANEDPRYRENFDIVSKLLENYFAQNNDTVRSQTIVQTPNCIGDCISLIKNTSGLTPTMLTPNIYSTTIETDDLHFYVAQHFPKLQVEYLKQTNTACLRDQDGAQLLIVGIKKTLKEIGS